MKISELVNEYPEIKELNYQEVALSEILASMGYAYDNSADNKFASIDEYSELEVEIMSADNPDVSEADKIQEEDEKIANEKEEQEGKEVEAFAEAYHTLREDSPNDPTLWDIYKTDKGYAVYRKGKNDNESFAGDFTATEMDKMFTPNWTEQVKTEAIAASTKENKVKNEIEIMKIYDEDNAVLLEAEIETKMDKDKNVDRSLTDLVEYCADKMGMEYNRLKYEWETNFTKEQKLELAKSYKGKKKPKMEIDVNTITIRSSELHGKLSELISKYYDETDNTIKASIKEEITKVEVELKNIKAAGNEEEKEAVTIDMDKEGTDVLDTINLGEGFVLHKDEKKDEFYVLDKEGTEIKRVPNVFVNDVARIIDYFRRDLGLEDGDVNVTKKENVNEDKEDKGNEAEVGKEIEKIVDKEVEKEGQKKDDENVNAPENKNDEELMKLKMEIEQKKQEVDRVISKLIKSGIINITREEILPYVNRGESAIFAKQKAVQNKLSQLAKKLIGMSMSDIKLIEDVFLKKVDKENYSNANSILMFLKK